MFFEILTYIIFLRLDRQVPGLDTAAAAGLRRPGWTAVGPFMRPQIRFNIVPTTSCHNPALAEVAGPSRQDDTGSSIRRARKSTRKSALVGHFFQILKRIGNFFYEIELWDNSLFFSPSQKRLCKRGRTILLVRIPRKLKKVNWILLQTIAIMALKYMYINITWQFFTTR